MYGLVHLAIQELLVTEHGHDVWRDVAERAGCAGIEFLAFESYEDEQAYALVQAASEALGLPAEAVLQAFGRYWLRYTDQQGYAHLLEISGQSFGEFMGALDEMHARVQLAYPRLRPPSFTLIESTEDSWVLRYRSSRQGLVPLARGVLHALGERFGLVVEIDYEDQDPAEGQTRGVFRVRAVGEFQNGDESTSRDAA